MYGDQSYVYQRIAATLYVVACLGGVEGGRGGGSEVKGEELGSGKKGEGREVGEGGSPFSISLFPPLPRFPAPSAQARVVGVHRSAGAYNPDCATSMHSCHGVFTDQFTFRTVLARILNIFKFHKPVRKTYRPKNDFFCLLIKFSFPF